MKYQNYKHYILPITINPLEYGKLIFKINNIFILQINKTNIVVITQNSDENHVKLFREGEFMFEYIDIKINESEFIRKLDNKKFKFKNNELFSTIFNISRAETVNSSRTFINNKKIIYKPSSLSPHYIQKRNFSSSLIVLTNLNLFKVNKKTKKYKN
jgi:hypothetical protein